MRVGYAMVFVSSMERSVAFYRDVVGLSVAFESTHWTEFETEGARLALHLADADALTMTDSPQPAGTCRPGFQVDDIDAHHQRMVEKGVIVLQPPTDLPGSRIAQYADPDGLQFSVSQVSNR